MRYLIISDLHANMEALEAVLATTEGEYAEVICCGDLVGYGPDPDPVVDWVRTHVSVVVRGNHDRVCSGIEDAEQFNESARMAAYWTRGHLKPENLQYLRDLPPGPLEISDRYEILHGSLRDEDEYVTTSWEAAESFDLLRHPLAFFGHTHQQGGFFRFPDRPVESIGIAVGRGKNRRVLELHGNVTYYLNPGSVGQPRDGDNRAAFAFYDTTGFVEYGRVAYDITTTMNKIRQAGLPEYLAQRLSIGR